MKSFIIIGISITMFLGASLAAVDPAVLMNLPIPPELTCVLIGDAACNRMCTMIGHIYAIPVNPATCNSNNNCGCTVIPHKYLDDLWKDKFAPMELLDTIKVTKKRYKEIVNSMRATFKTREQTKQDLEWLLTPSNFAKIRVNDDVAKNMIKNNGKGGFDHDIIRAYVSKNLKSDPLQLSPDIDYKTRLFDALEKAPNEDIVQYIIHDVRRSNNRVLNDLADQFLKEKNIQEDVYDDEDVNETLTDILDSMVVSEIITPSEDTFDENNAQLSNTNENNATSDRWDLPDLDVDSVKKFEDGYNCWDHKNPYYSVCLFKTFWGDHQVDWRKEKDVVEISATKKGEVEQKWKFDGDVEISVHKMPNGDFEQIWKLGPDTQYKNVKSGNEVSETWMDDEKDEQALTKYKSIIDSWCDKNSLFIDEKSCIIY